MNQSLLVIVIKLIELTLKFIINLGLPLIVGLAAYADLQVSISLLLVLGAVSRCGSELQVFELQSQHGTTPIFSRLHLLVVISCCCVLGISFILVFMLLARIVDNDFFTIELVTQVPRCNTIFSCNLHRLDRPWIPENL